MLKGKVYKFGDDIDTDVIVPATYLSTFDPKELAKHCMEYTNPDFYGKVKEGDIITQINGINVTSDDIVLDIIENSVAGDTITVTVISGNTTKTFEAELKANIGTSSYSSTINSESNADGGSGNSGDGTFDFPFGE